MSGRARGEGGLARAWGAQGNASEGFIDRNERRESEFRRDHPIREGGYQAGLVKLVNTADSKSVPQGYRFKSDSRQRTLLSLKESSL